MNGKTIVQGVLRILVVMGRNLLGNNLIWILEDSFANFLNYDYFLTADWKIFGIFWKTSGNFWKTSGIFWEKFL